jgi:hypothetical protein
MPNWGLPRIYVITCLMKGDDYDNLYNNF